jgi:hypothetical protein
VPVAAKERNADGSTPTAGHLGVADLDRALAEGDGAAVG